MSEQVQEETPVEPTETPTEAPTEPTEQPTEEPSEPTEPTEEPTEADEPTEEEPSEEPTEEPTEEDDFDYTEYTDPARRQIVDILRESEIPVEEAQEFFAEALKTQDVTKINQEALREKLGDKKAELVMLLAESYYKGAFQEMQALKDKAFEVTGGEDNFNAIKEWAQGKAESDPEFAKDLEEIRGLIATETPRGVQAGMKALVDLYKADPNTTVPADLEVGDKAAGENTAQPLSRLDYAREVEKAMKKGNYDDVIGELKKRRQAGIKQGI